MMDTKIEHPAIDKIREDLDSKTKEMLGDIEESVQQFRLSDAIREGSKYTEQAYTWRDGDKVCALGAAALSLEARGY